MSFYSELKQIDNLPSIPAVTARILEISNSESSSASDLTNIIKMDQSISVRMLKLVNSAYYGMSGKIKTIDRAVVLLGFNTVKSLALSTSVLSIFSKKIKIGFSFKKFWKHSISVGIVSDLIAKNLGFHNISEIFVSGMIHDIGKVVLAEYFTDDFLKIIEYKDKNNISIREAEKKILDCDHTLLGNYILEKWNFPENMRMPVKYHHTPEFADNEDFATPIVFLANLICKSKHIGDSGDFIIPEISNDVLNKININEQKFKLIFKLVDSKIKEMNAIIYILNS